MAGFASALVGEIFEFCSLDFLGMSKGARRVYVSGYGYDVTIEDDYAIVRTPSSRGQGLKFPRSLRLGKFTKLIEKDLCSPGCKVPAVTIFGDPSKKWIPFKKGVIQIDDRRSMTVFKRDGSVERITIDVPMWGVSA
jgi:hypothetical protein